ncbi:MAG: hypothetical protein PHC80_06400 [Eubacteriales bacterium]|nr:hypothetical protein [Eubacteriales bacterium]
MATKKKEAASKPEEKKAKTKDKGAEAAEVKMEGLPTEATEAAEPSDVEEFFAEGLAPEDIGEEMQIDVSADKAEPAPDDTENEPMPDIGEVEEVEPSAKLKAFDIDKLTAHGKKSTPRLVTVSNKMLERDDNPFRKNVNEDEESAESDNNDAKQQTLIQLYSSMNGGTLLKGMVSGACHLGSAKATSEQAHDPEYLKDHIFAKVRYGMFDVLISYRDFFPDVPGVAGIPQTEQQPSVQLYSRRIQNFMRQGTCTVVDFLVKGIFMKDGDADSNTPIAITGNRREAMRRRMMADYCGLDANGRPFTREPAITVGKKCNARVVNKRNDSITVELSGVQRRFFNEDLCWSRRPERIEKIRNDPSGHIWVYVSRIRYNPETQRLSVLFSPKPPLNPMSEIKDNYIVGARVKCEVLRLYSNGVFLEAIEDPGVVIQCAFENSYAAASLKRGDHAIVTISHVLRAKNRKCEYMSTGEYYMTGHVIASSIEPASEKVRDLIALRYSR